MSEPPTGAERPNQPEVEPDEGEHEIDEPEIDEAIIVQVSDYLDGALTGAEHAQVAQRIAEDATWKRAHAELSETRRFLSGLRKAHAAPEFAHDVTSKIHQRSAGRFFGRRTFGDRVPFGVLVAVALAGLLVIGFILWSSSTGSLKVDRERERRAHPTAPAVTPP